MLHRVPSSQTIEMFDAELFQLGLTDRISISVTLGLDVCLSRFWHKMHNGAQTR
jgi:hypothetical protein